MKVSGFYPAKNKFIEPFCKCLQQQKARGKPVTIIRMEALHDRMTCTEWKLNSKVKFMACDTPQ